MLQLSAQTILSPRFFALPIIALTVIVSLAYVSRSPAVIGTQVAGPTVYRAINCADPAKATASACTVATDRLRTVR